MPFDDFYYRFDTLAELVKRSGPDGAVRLPEETSWDAFERNTRDGIVLEQGTLDALEKLASSLGIELPWKH